MRSPHVTPPASPKANPRRGANGILKDIVAMAEVYEIADLVVPGHDNLFINPRTQGL